MCGCLVVGLLVILVFGVVPLPLWPLLVVGLGVLFVLAAGTGLLKGILGVTFGRR
jgi:ABC-type polysaccharide/polyol phosphate export permease